MATVRIGENTGDDYSGTEDCHLKSTDVNVNYATTNPLEITKWVAGNHTHSLVSFSGLSNIAASATVSAATLGIYVTATTTGGGRTGTLRRLLRAWNVAQATWNVYTTGNSWTTAGAKSDGNDRSATTSGTVSLVTANAYTTNSDAQLVTDVQGFIDGTYGNYGWHFEKTSDANDGEYCRFAPEEGTDGQRPYLSVTYTDAGGGTPIAVLAYPHFRRRRL